MILCQKLIALCFNKISKAEIEILVRKWVWDELKLFQREDFLAAPCKFPVTCGAPKEKTGVEEKGS